MALGTAADVGRPARAAEAAFPAWAAMEGQAILHRIVDLIKERAEKIALGECRDAGQAWRLMSKVALRWAEDFRVFADLAPGARDGQSLPTATHLNVTSRHPIRPVRVITPWNTPLMLSTWKIAPALTAGCTVIHKPAELSSLTARRLAEICHEAGLPPGVLNLVNGMGEGAGRALTEHPAIKAIAFVGESRTGSMIMKQGADTLKRLHFELGGKNPVVVFDAADLDRAVDAVIFMIHSLNGERSPSSSRLLVQKTIADAFHARLVEQVNRICVGHFAKVSGYVQTGLAEGAVLAATVATGRSISKRRRRARRSPLALTRSRVLVSDGGQHAHSRPEAASVLQHRPAWPCGVAGDRP